MNDFSRLTAVYADDLQLQREQSRRRTLRHTGSQRRTARDALASGLHRLADRLDTVAH